MIKKIQKLATLPEGRPETGAMSFGDDWPGLFIRGDNAFAFALALRSVLANAKSDRIDWLSLGVLQSRRDTRKLSGEMMYRLEEYLAGRWFLIRAFPTRAEAKGFAYKVGGNWQIRYEAEKFFEEEYLVD